MKLGMDEVLNVLYKCCCFSAGSTQGRIQGGAKIRNGGPLLQRMSSSDWKDTATNRMHSSDLKTCEKKCCYFLFHSEVKFWTPSLLYPPQKKFGLYIGITLSVCLSVCSPLFYRSCDTIFKAQEPKAPLTYCDHALSGVRPSSVRHFYIFNFSRTA